MLHKLSEDNIDIALISEPYKKDDCHAWFHDTTKKAAILVANRNSYIREASEQNKYYVYATLKDIRIYSCYFPPSLDLESFSEQINELERSIRSAKDSVIIAGDFNSKSPEWGSKTLDRRGKIVSELIASLGLMIYNRGDSATFRGSRGNSIIDITFGSLDLYTEAMNWRVLEDVTLSDHQYISFNIDRRNTKQSIDLNLPRWNTRKLNNDIFLNKTHQIKRVTNLESLNLENIVDTTIKTITKCCNVSMPRAKEYDKKKRPAFWWTPEIGKLRSECLHARRIATRNHTNGILAENYKKARKKLRTAIKNSKREKWKELCETVDADPWGKPYKIVTSKLSIRKPIPGIREAAWATEIVSTLFPTDSEWRGRNQKITPEKNFVPFDVDELNAACKKLKANKSPGPDGIPNEALKLVGQHWPELLLTTYNKCFSSGCFPKCWKKQSLVLLRKDNKPLNMPNSYRPLCMINTLGKLYESLIYNRLDEDISRRGGLSTKQYGFRKGKSTVGAIQEVVDIATAAKSTKKFCIVITLDIKNAFNTVKWNVVLESCKNRGIDTYLYNTLVDYLSDRVLVYQTEEGIKEYDITAGVPQGSVLGPLLWNTMYDGLLNLSLPNGAQLIGYADDVALVISHELPQALEIIANDSLSRCDRWLREHGLELAAEKTEAILITNRRAFERPQIRIQGISITLSQSLRYLGIQLDKSLRFNVHLKNIRDNALKTANTLARIMPNIRGPKESTRRLINSVTHSQMLYAAPIFAPAIKAENTTLMLLRPQRISALRVISAYRTVSTTAALVLAGIAPIDLECEEI